MPALRGIRLGSHWLAAALTVLAGWAPTRVWARTEAGGGGQALGGPTARLLEAGRQLRRAAADAKAVVLQLERRAEIAAAAAPAASQQLRSVRALLSGRPISSSDRGLGAELSALDAKLVSVLSEASRSAGDCGPRSIARIKDAFAARRRSALAASDAQAARTNARRYRSHADAQLQGLVRWLSQRRDPGTAGVEQYRRDLAAGLERVYAGLGAALGGSQGFQAAAARYAAAEDLTACLAQAVRLADARGEAVAPTRGRPVPATATAPKPAATAAPEAKAPLAKEAKPAAPAPEPTPAPAAPTEPKGSEDRHCRFLIFFCDKPKEAAKPPEVRPNPDPGGCRLWIFFCDKPPEGVEYKPVQGQPFIEGAGDGRAVHPSDVNQGQTGDCYLLASLASVANQNPEVIRNMVHDNGDGTYSVTFQQPRNWWEFWKPEYSPVTVRVDGQFPTRNGSPVFAQPADRAGNDAELWTMLVEKAYASMNGNFARIGNGGYPSEAMERITGRPSATQSASGVTLEQLAQWQQQGQAVSVGTLAKKTFPWQTDIFNDPLYRDQALVPSHAYWVQSVDTQAGTVTLANPWGWNTDRVTLTEEEFQRALNQVYVNPIR